MTSVVGSGGKTTLLRTLGTWLATVRDARVVLATTTHFLAFDGMPLVTSAEEHAVAEAFAVSPLICAGSPMETPRASSTPKPLTSTDAHGIPAEPDGQTPVVAAAREQRSATRANGCAPKLGPSPLPPARLAELADYVLVEADGSKRLPLKAHAVHEPVVPTRSTQTVLVVGASGFGQPVGEAVHRPELFCERTDCTPETLATPELVAHELVDEVRRGLLTPTRIVVNQVETTERLAAAHTFEHELRRLGLNLPVLAGSLRNDELEVL